MHALIMTNAGKRFFVATLLRMTMNAWFVVILSEAKTLCRDAAAFHYQHASTSSFFRAVPYHFASLGKLSNPLKAASAAESRSTSSVCNNA